MTTYLFDLDDTLIDSKIYAELYTPVLEMIESELHIDIDEKAKELGIEKNKFNRYDTGDLCRELNLLDKYYSLLEEKIKLIPVLKEEMALKLKSVNGRKGIVSNSMRRTVNAYISKYNFEVDFVFCYDDAHCQKSSIEYWEKLIKKENLVPSGCVVIGDDPIDDKKVPASLGFQIT